MADPTTPWPTPTQNKSWLARRWKLLVGLLVAFLLVGVAAVCGIVWLFLSSTRGSVVAREAMAKARSNSAVVQQLGAPIEEGWLVSTSMNASTSGSGDADLHIPISGPKGEGTIHVNAHESDGVWTYSVMQVEFEGQAEKIDLLTGSPESEPDTASTPAPPSAAETRGAPAFDSSKIGVPASEHTYSGHLNLTWLVILFLVFLAYHKRHKFLPVKVPGEADRGPVGNATTYATDMPTVNLRSPVARSSGMPTTSPPPPVLGAGGIFGYLFQSLVGLVFAGTGLFMLTHALGSTHSSKNDLTELYAGIFFSLLGLSVVFWGVYIARRTLRLKMRRAKYPAEPWLWRKDWAQGRASSKIGKKLLIGWALAGFFTATLTLIFRSLMNLPQEVHKSGPGAYLILTIPVFSAISLIYAIRETIVFFEFGRTYFEMSSVPGVIGGALQGFIQAHFPHSPNHGIHLQLSCVHRYHGGESSSSSLLWRGETKLSSEQLSPGPAGTAIPVAFRIPLDAKPTEQLSTNHEILWQLEAIADVPGVKYHDIFEVPIFRTQQSLASTQAEPSVPSAHSATVAVEPPGPAVAAPSVSSWKELSEVLTDVGDTGRIGTLHGTFGPLEAGQSIARPESLSFEVRENAEGTEFYFPASRNLRSAILLTGAMLFCCAFTAFAILEHLPVVVQVFSGVFSLIWIYGTMQTWVGNTRVVIGNGSLTLRSSLLGSGKVRQIPFSEIASIRAGIGGTDQMGDTLTPTYCIELLQRNGKKLGLAQSRDKREIEWLLQEMCRLAGLLPKR